MIAWTSRLSLLSEVPKLSGLRSRVYQVIAAAPEPGPCISEIAAALGMKEGSVCGRIDELRKLGVIEDAPLKQGPCGKLVKTYRALAWHEADPTEPAQPDLFQQP